MGQLKSKSIVLLLSILLIPLIVFGETIVNNDFIWVDNIKIDGNTISSEDTDGNVILNPNGTGNVRFPDLTASRVVYLDASNNLVSSDITYTTLTYLDATSSIQDQIDTKAPTASPTFTGTVTTPALNVTNGLFYMAEVASQGVTPSSGYMLLYPKNDNSLYTKNSSGTEVNLTTHGLSGAVVGTSDSQTITNKEIVAANNTITTSPSGNLTSTDLDSALAELQTDVDSRLLTSSILDEDDMATDSATLPATQQSIKAYVDAEVAGAAAGAKSVVTKTTTYTIQTSDYTVLADASGAAFTLTLPTAVGNSGLIFVIKKIDSDTTKPVTIDGDSAETIDGASTYLLYGENDSVQIQSDGTNWVIINLSTSYYVESKQTTFTNFSTYGSAGAWVDLTSLSLGAGTWDINATANFYSNGATTTTAVNIGISTTSGNDGTGLAQPDTSTQRPMDNTSGNTAPLVLGELRVGPSATTTYYLKSFAGNSNSSLQVVYKMTADRKR